MSFREKSAWGMLCAMVLSGAYYAWASSAIPFGAPPEIHRAALAPFVTIILMATIAIRVVLALKWSKEAGTPADEREKIAIYRSGNWSGYIAKLALLWGVVSYIVFVDYNLMFTSIIFGLIISQIVEYVLLIAMFRREI